MKEFDIFVPLKFNDGSSVPDALFRKLQRRWLDQFSGLTYFPQPNRGFWKMGDITYRDEIVIYRQNPSKLVASWSVSRNGLSGNFGRKRF